MQDNEPTVENPGAPPKRRIAIAIGAIAVLVVVAIVALVWHAESRTNKVALTDSAKPVTVVAAKDASFRTTRKYIGTLLPWVEAQVGPQLVSAYISSVIVRPGSVVKRNDILATLDCRNSSAASQAVAMQARAIAEQQKAQASEAARYQGLLTGGFASPNEVEQKTAQSTAQEAQLEAARARLAATSLGVSDCVLRAPFDGEIATRTMDPGAFVHPGTSIVSIVDRATIRFVADVPEADFGVVPPLTPVRIHVISTNVDVVGAVTRRAPSADVATRTVHFEVDLPDPERKIPTGTTGEAHIEVGEPQPAIEIPLAAAMVRGDKASLFVVEGDVAHARKVIVLGESGGSLFVDPQSLKAGAKVVLEGRALLEEGDKVAAKDAESATTTAPADTAAATAPTADVAR